MLIRGSAVLCAIAALAAAGLQGCGGDDGGGTEARDSLRVYSSLPKQGASRDQIAAIVGGIDMALEQAGGRAGPFAVEHVSLDDSTAQAGNWTPEAASANARRAAQDERAVAYIGEFNSGATAITLPILNEAGLAQVSPSNTAVGLTTDEPGAAPGEPAKYYPTGVRTFARITPKDTVQGAALATLMQQDGCTKAQIYNDKEVYGAGLSANIEAAAAAIGLAVVSNEAIDRNSPNFRSLAQEAAGAGADCMVFAGVTANGAIQLYKDFAAAVPGAKLYGPDGVAESGFADPGKGGLPVAVGNRVKVTIATLAPDEYPEEGREFFDAYEAKHGHRPDPYGLYGYEAMLLVLDAIARSRSGERADVVKALLETRDRASVLGTYSIDENGDTTLTDYGVYQIAGGQLEFEQTIRPAAG